MSTTTLPTIPTPLPNCTNSNFGTTLAVATTSSGPQFRLLRIVRPTQALTSNGQIMLRTLSMPGQEVFRSMQVHTSSKTPYSDATQVSHFVTISIFLQGWSEISGLQTSEQYILQPFTLLPQ